MLGFLPVLFVIARLSGLAVPLLLVPYLVERLVYGASFHDGAEYLLPAAASLALFLLSHVSMRGHRPHLRTPLQGFLCVTVAWVVFAAIGGLPYLVGGHVDSFVDAFFEAMSGFTTTGASVFPVVEELPKGILLWRAMTQFVGGLGIIALFVAVLPALGAGGVVLFRSEVAPSLLEDRLRPRIHDTAQVLWMVYVGLCLLEFIALMLCDVPAFDAVCHALTTVSTGGFSTQNDSVASFTSSAQWVVIVFMFLGGTSFLLHGRAISGDVKCYLRSEEFLLYVGITLAAIGVASVLLVATRTPVDAASMAALPPIEPDAHDTGLLTTVRDASFQVLSIMTTTGFCNVDFDRWADPLRFLLVLLMMIGACSGSTAGGIKVFRFLLIWRAIARQVTTLLSPSRVVTVRFSGTAVPNETLLLAMMLLVLFVALAVVGSFFLVLLGVPLLEAITGTVACLCCIGPALGDVGPAGSYAAVPASGKVVLSVLMLMGRLEIYAVLALLGSLGRK